MEKDSSEDMTVKRAENSAHDDIKLIDGQQTEADIKRLKSKNFINEAKVLELISDINECNQPKPASTTLQIKRTSKQGEVSFFEFELSSLPDNLQNIDCPNEMGSKLNEMIDEESSIKLTGELDHHAMELDTLLTLMDSYSLGRPSTFASVLDKLETLEYIEDENNSAPEPAGLIEVNKFDGSVMLNATGLKVLLLMKQEHPRLANKELSAELSKIFDAVAVPVEEGDSNIRDSMKKIAEKIFDEDEFAKVNLEPFQSLDELCTHKNS